MGYYNLIYQNGENNFLKNCKSSGVDGSNHCRSSLIQKIKILQISVKKKALLLFNFYHQLHQEIG